MRVEHEVEIENMTLDIFNDRFNWYRAGRAIAMTSGETDAMISARMHVIAMAASRTYVFEYPQQGMLGQLRIDQVAPTRVRALVSAPAWAAAHWTPTLIAWLSTLAAPAVVTVEPSRTPDEIADYLKLEIKRIADDHSTRTRDRLGRIDGLLARMNAHMEAKDIADLLFIARDTVNKYRQQNQES